jgi:hypothetical protein
MIRRLLCWRSYFSGSAGLDKRQNLGGIITKWLMAQAGVSRSATTVISYLMKDEGLTFEDGLSDIISRRDCVAPNRGFCDQLKILQDQCGGQLGKYEPEMLRVSSNTAEDKGRGKSRGT